MSKVTQQGVEAVPTRRGMSVRTASRLEYSVIGLGIFALLLIFQPFSLALYGIGCGLVVLAGLVNNLLPLCQPGVRMRSVMTGALIVAMIFCFALLVSIAAAYLYGYSVRERHRAGHQRSVLSSALRLGHRGRSSVACGNSRGGACKFGA